MKTAALLTWIDESGIPAWLYIRIADKLPPDLPWTFGTNAGRRKGLHVNNKYTEVQNTPNKTSWIGSDLQLGSKLTYIYIYIYITKTW